MAKAVMLVAKRERKKTSGPIGAAGEEKILRVLLASPEGNAADEGDDRQINEDDDDGIITVAPGRPSRCLGQAVFTRMAIMAAARME